MKAPSSLLQDFRLIKIAFKESFRTGGSLPSKVAASLRKLSKAMRSVAHSTIWGPMGLPRVLSAPVLLRLDESGETRDVILVPLQYRRILLECFTTRRRQGRWRRQRRRLVSRSRGFFPARSRVFSKGHSPTRSSRMPRWSRRSRSP